VAPTAARTELPASGRFCQTSIDPSVRIVPSAALLPKSLTMQKSPLLVTTVAG
jgi:hypothetical protein